MQQEVGGGDIGVWYALGVVRAAGNHLQRSRGGGLPVGEQPVDGFDRDVVGCSAKAAQGGREVHFASPSAATIVAPGPVAIGLGPWKRDLAAGGPQDAAT